MLFSYGATTVLYSFMLPLEVICMQRLNRWQYDCGVARCQNKLVLKELSLCFSITAEGTLINFNCRNNSIEKDISKRRIFKSHYPVQINETLYTFSQSPLQAWRHECIKDRSKRVAAGESYAQSRSMFSVTNYAGKFMFITGGIVDRKVVNTVLSFDVAKQAFVKKDAV